MKFRYQNDSFSTCQRQQPLHNSKFPSFNLRKNVGRHLFNRRRWFCLSKRSYVFQKKKDWKMHQKKKKKNTKRCKQKKDWKDFTNKTFQTKNGLRIPKDPPMDGLEPQNDAGVICIFLEFLPSLGSGQLPEKLP